MLNKVILLGRLAASPELRQTPGNVPVCAFSVAVSRPCRKEKETGADFIDCVAWRGTAEFVCKYFQKGKPIAIEGRLQTRSYQDKQGNKRKAVEVQCDSVGFVEGDKGNREPEKNDTGEFQEVDDYGDLPF